MTVYKNNNQWDKSNISCQSGLVLDYNKNRPNSEMQYIDYGLSVFDNDVFEKYPDKKEFDLSEVVNHLISKKQLAAYEITERFYEIGSSAGLKALEAYLSPRNQTK